MLPPHKHTFETLWGNVAARSLVPRLLAAGRLPHAILLTGPDSVGKRSLAFAMAKAILSIPRIPAGGQGFTFAPMQPSPPSIEMNDIPVVDSPDEADALGEDLFGDSSSSEDDDLFGTPTPPAPAQPPVPIPAVKKFAAINSTSSPVFSSPAVTPLLSDRVNRLIENSYPVDYTADGLPKSVGHADFTIIEPAGGRRGVLVDQIRYLKDITAVAPMEGEFRVAIVIGADSITPEGANSILKLLEEPPRYLVLILVANRASRVLPTIRSRCAMVPLLPMSRDDLTDKLVSEEKLDPARARVAAALSEGRPGAALTMIESALLDRRKEIFSARLQVDRVGRTAIPHAAARVIATGRLDEALWMMLSFARDRLVRTLVPAQPNLLVHGDALDLIDAKPAEPLDLDAEADRLIETYGLMAHPYLPNPRAALELALWPD